MEASEIVKRIQRCMAEVLALEPDQIRPDQSLVAELGADSLDLVELMYKLEAEFDLRLGKDDLSLSAQIGLPEEEIHVREVLTPRALERLRAPILRGPRVLELLRTIRRSCDYLVLTGGEPLRHPDLETILRGLPGVGFDGVILTTNGHDLARFLSAVAPAVTQLVVSLQTLSAERADRWYGAGAGAASAWPSAPSSAA